MQEKNQNSIDSLQEVINKKAEVRLRNDLFALYSSMQKNKLLNKHSGNKVPELMVAHPKADVQDVRCITGDKDEATGKTFKAIKLNDIEKGDIPDILYMNHVDVRMDSDNVSSYVKELFDYWLPIYIKEETLNFIKKIDEVSEQVEYLSSSVSGLENGQNY